MNAEQLACEQCQTTPGWHAGLHVGHIWTEVRCPAYRSSNGDDCACNGNRPRRCSCAHNSDGTVTTLLCPLHADTDPCLTSARVTGRRRKGTIRRGVCTSCGHGSVTS